MWILFFCNRDDDKAGYFHMTIRDTEGGVDQDVVSASAESVRPIVGDLQQRRFEFRPPGQIRWHTFFKKQVCWPKKLHGLKYIS